MSRPAVSVVIPVHDEETNVPIIVDEVKAALPNVDWELIFVDDGSRDRTLSAAKECAEQDDRIRVLRLGRNYGQSTALQAGFDHAEADVIVSLDGDLQNDPAEIPIMLDRLSQGFDVVVGYRANRFATEPARAIPSRIANWLIQLWTGVRIRDTGCTFKAFRRDVIERLYLYSDFHRFVPMMAVAVAGARIAEQPVTNRPRRFGHSKYGLRRAPAVISDLLVLDVIRRSPDLPLRFFARWSAIALILGTTFALVLDGLNLVLPLFDRNALVLPGAMVLLLALAAHLFMLGLIAEVFLFLKRGGFTTPRPAKELPG